jgi:hypothetical protein
MPVSHATRPHPDTPASNRTARQDSLAPRAELRAQVFFHDHLPAIAVRNPLDAGGHLEHSWPTASAHADEQR